MSKRKTRKEKVIASERKMALDAQIKELEALKDKVLELEKTIAYRKKENFKQLNIRNLKVFASTCNFLAPFIVSTGLIVGVVYIGGGFLPFHIDEITTYKDYSLNFQTNGYVTMNEEYNPHEWYNETTSSSNKLTLYTPWELQDDYYIRFKREYNIGKLTTLDLYNAVLTEDYDYINENLKDYKEEKQIINEINLDENDYFLEASLYVTDIEDSLKYDETVLHDRVMAIIESVIGPLLGSGVAFSRNFKYLSKLKQINENYNYSIKNIESLEKELKETNVKILSLTQNEDGKRK